MKRGLKVLLGFYHIFQGITNNKENAIDTRDHIYFFQCLKVDGNNLVRNFEYTGHQKK